MDDEYERRWRAIQQEMAVRGTDYMLITPSADLYYTTGYAREPSERLLALLIARVGQPLFVVPRLEAAGLANLASFAIHKAWDEAEDPIDILAAAIRAAGPPQPVVAICEQAWAGTVLRLQEALGDAQYVRAQPVLAEHRLIKSPAEIDLLQTAASLADEAFRRLLEQPLAGKTEAEVAELVSRLLLQAGLEKVSFVIAGSGPNSASPHHTAGSRRLELGDALVVDFGGTYQHYQSDITRTITIGPARSDIAEVHELVAQAQEAAFRTVRPGSTAGEVDAAARQHLTAAGFGANFTHRTGHGLGLDIHEEPYIMPGSALPLREGMVFSIEPGVYLPGKFGVRIEDIVVVTADGGRRLNGALRDLVSVQA
ncbi:MAG: M24 family metallopeptidase [Chloroflexota bacterium]